MRLDVRTAVVALFVLALVLVFAVPFVAQVDPARVWTTGAAPATGDVSQLFWVMFWIGAAIALIVIGGVVLSVLLFRERPGHEAKTFRGDPLLEFAWTLIPALIILGIFVGSFKSLQTLSATGAPDLTIEVVARQWEFDFKYPDGTRVTREMHIPTNKKVSFMLTSADVIHAFWVPALSGKMDNVPGRWTEVWMTATEPGVYKGQCAEFCGLGHADMLIVVVAEPEEQFAKWLEDTKRAQAERPADLVAAGRQVAQQTCAQCHSFEKGKRSPNPLAPNLSEYGAKGPFSAQLKALKERDPEWLKKWVESAPEIKPGTAMPPWKGVLTAAQIEAVVEFLKTLK